MPSFKHLLLLVFVFVFANPIYSTCFYGGHITYVHTGGYNYDITYTFYRECSGIAAPNIGLIAFVCESNPSLDFTSNLNPVPGTGVEITLGCSAYPTSCNGGSNSQLGVEEYVYKGSVLLPPCSNWKMSTFSYCRYSASTISVNKAHVQTEFSSVIDNDNSSPVFGNDPIFNLCLNQPTQFNLGVWDPDGDSLVYSFYAPFSFNDSTSVPYNYSYSSTNFLDTAIMVPLDSVTGELLLLGTTNILTVMGVKIEEWRTINGVPAKIGTVYKDMHLKVDYCTNELPVLSGFDFSLSSYSTNDSSYQANVFLGDTVRFHINGHDADTFQSTVIGNPERYSISLNKGISNSSFQVYNNATDSAYALFLWVPDSADLFKNYSFSLTIEDEACPYYGMQSFTYSLFVDTVNTTEISGLNQNRSFQVYPIPVRDFVTIAQTQFIYKQMFVYSIDGRLIRRIDLHMARQKVDLLGLPSGIYFLKPVSSEGKVKKIVKL